MQYLKDHGYQSINQSINQPISQSVNLFFLSQSQPRSQGLSSSRPQERGAREMAGRREALVTRLSQSPLVFFCFFDRPTWERAWNGLTNLSFIQMMRSMKPSKVKAQLENRYVCVWPRNHRIHATSKLKHESLNFTASFHFDSDEPSERKSSIVMVSSATSDN